MSSVEKILVPIDYNDYSSHSLKYASKYARELNATICLLYVIDPYIFRVEQARFKDPDAVARDDTVDYEKSAELALKTIAEKEIDPGIKVEYIVKIGNPHEIISETASEKFIDLIILATHGFSGIKHLLMGSTTEKVLRRTHCPVISLKEPVDQEEMKFMN